MDFNDAGGGAFTQGLCESATYGGGAGYSLSSPLPSAACGESCAATTTVQADIDACAAISLTGTDYSGDVGADRRVECEGTADPCQYTAPSTCTAAICCDGAAPFLLLSPARARARSLFSASARAPAVASSRSGLGLPSDSSRPRVGAAPQTSMSAPVRHVSRAPPALTHQRRVSGIRVSATPATLGRMTSMATGRGALRALRLTTRRLSRATRTTTAARSVAPATRRTRQGAAPIPARTSMRATLTHVSPRAPPVRTQWRRTSATRASVRMATSGMMVRTGLGRHAPLATPWRIQTPSRAVPPATAAPSALRASCTPTTPVAVSRTPATRRPAPPLMHAALARTEVSRLEATTVRMATRQLYAP